VAAHRRRLAPALIAAGALALGACGSGGSGAHASNGFHAVLALPTVAKGGRCPDDAVKGADDHCYRVGSDVVGTDAIETAQPGTNAGGASVDLVLTDAGLNRFNKLAATCYAHRAGCRTGRIALVVDGEVFAAPTIASASYTKGSLSVSGALTSTDARRVARVLTAG